MVNALHSGGSVPPTLLFRKSKTSSFCNVLHADGRLPNMSFDDILRVSSAVISLMTVGNVELKLVEVR